MSYDTQLLYSIAHLYYNDNLTQDSIARRLKISKYKVNRMLKRAKTEGIVQINIIKPK